MQKDEKLKLINDTCESIQKISDELGEDFLFVLGRLAQNFNHIHFFNGVLEPKTRRDTEFCFSNAELLELIEDGIVNTRIEFENFYTAQGIDFMSTPVSKYKSD